MSTQSEQQLENELIAQLAGSGFERVVIENTDALKANLKAQLERGNGIALTDREFENVLISLEKDYNAQLTFRADPNFHVENYRVIDVETGAAYG